MSYKNTTWTDEQKKSWSEKCKKTRANNVNKRIGIDVENRRVNQKIYARNHYIVNKEKIKIRAIVYKESARIRNKKFVDDFLLKNPCVDCNERDLIVLEFDHVRGKKKMNISDAVRRGWSIESIKNEMDKCEVRCANCHRRITHSRKTKKTISKSESHKIGSQII